MTMVCGRPYVLFDPEQTAALTRAERKNDAIDRIVNGLNEALRGIEDYVEDVGADEELRLSIIDAIRALEYGAFVVYDNGALHSRDEFGYLMIEWKGERGLI
ncbi:hypothetical protein [Brevibacillus laterosporus]|uniref:Uncharacterized protein n=1 Tax=Brevibacillus laterosporus TaxID=1465 RepID=A0AAP3DHL3_BRELA|nr:hypothetical protein [Brevibacillus laterosporus]MCR8981474.1 hypothetical protein [Brevibacillus laterosporus]MCZ0808629.1 hypothetical protein [Brevibacillus laterosporus]MCZ0827091.1 hypothetical protein [Brevibacillus laterosporus]MCZ0850799.1 hypothetical protein [Brevibacillus laterosporus]